MRLLIDVNLAPRWVPWLAAHGLIAEHWTALGDPRAPDTEIMRWARANGRVVFTHDLDFGHLLAMSGDNGPSVIQVRCPDPSPELIGGVVLRALDQFASQIETGALVVVEEKRQRVRLLPLR